MKKRNVLIIIIVIAVAAVAAFLVIRLKGGVDENSSASLDKTDEAGIAVEAYHADYGSVIPSVNASGLITGKEEAVLVSETRGVIESVSAQIGDFLKKGDPILRVDSSVAKLSMSQAKQQLRSSQIDFDSVKRAYDGGNASEAELARSRGKLSGAEAAYENAVNRFENTVIKAPFDGFLADLEIGIGTGNFISEGVRIGRLVDISSVKVDLFLGGSEVQRIQKGARAVVTTASRTLEGQVDAIALSSDINTGSFRVVILAPNPYGEEIRSGFAADVTIDLPEKDSVIVIPDSALLNIAAERWVYTIENNRAVLKRVVPGTLSGSLIEILSGLEAGESVVTTGLKSLSDGALVIPEYRAERAE